MSGHLARAGEEGQVTIQELLGRVLVGIGIAALGVGIAVAVWAASQTTWVAVAGGVSAAVGAAVALAALRLRQNMLALRVLELVVFAAMIGAIGAAAIGTAGGDTWLRSALQLAVVIFAYGALIPNSPGRSALMILLWTALSAGIVALSQWQVGSLGAESAGPLVILGLAATVAVAGSCLIGLFRDVAIETRTGNMYNLYTRLGAGGMGEVWRAEHQRLARPAAIKIIRPDRLGDDPEEIAVLRAQFEREARTTAQLRSPNTIQVYDVGSTSDGTFYFVMEYLEGLDLKTMVERYGPLPPARAIYILVQACRSLFDAHEHALVHRDIKPANIFVSKMGGSFDYVKVLDFGLARAAGGEDDGTITGTPGYLAPETITGDHPVDARADIYALGCVAYHLVTGEQVFTETELVKLAAAHVSRTPIRPSLRTEIDIPEQLEKVILRCLEKDPADRFATARELATALEAIDAGPPWTADDAEAWWNRVRPAPPSSSSSASEPSTRSL